KPISQWRTDRALEDEMAKDLGADSLRFLSHEALFRALDLPAERLCLACINNEYPTPWGTRLAAEAFEQYKANPSSAEIQNGK
ncbi:MAG: hypothetical protein J6S42_05700, partial [Thermoguttaceae bacterium]|nr:hypothetical protein [Thermoguttaceae bacterium]